MPIRKHLDNGIRWLSFEIEAPNLEPGLCIHLLEGMGRGMVEG
jgi:hypothetical protein